MVRLIFPLLVLGTVCFAQPDACGLLRGGEVRSAERRAMTGGSSVCRYGVGDGGILTVVVRRVPARWAAEQIERMAKNPERYREAELGDRSFLFDMGEAGAALCIFQGEYYVQLSVFRMGRASSVRPVLERLAVTALERL